MYIYMYMNACMHAYLCSLANTFFSYFLSISSLSLMILNRDINSNMNRAVNNYRLID